MTAEHAARENGERLGASDGTHGQVFELRHTPVLALNDGELLEVREPESRLPLTAWTPVYSFVDSGPDDRHSSSI